MKKLLSLLFVLGSVSALANVETMHGGQDDCYKNPVCGIEKTFNVDVKIPEKLEIERGDNINLLWCGTQQKTFKKENHYKIKGEKKSTVKVTFVGEGNKEGELKFRLKGKGPGPSNKVAFTGIIRSLDNNNKLTLTKEDRKSVV